MPRNFSEISVEIFFYLDRIFYFYLNNKRIMALITLYHATDGDNEESILKKGILTSFEGVYLTDSEESATRWISFRLKTRGKPKMSVFKVEVEESLLEEGTDHSPMMVQIFGVGKSFVYPKNIPPTSIKEVAQYEINN